MAASFVPLMMVASMLSSLAPSLEARSSDGAAWLWMLGAVCSGKQQDLVFHPISSSAWAPGGAQRCGERSIRQKLQFLVLNVFAARLKLFKWSIYGEGTYFGLQVRMELGTRSQCSGSGDPT